MHPSKDKTEIGCELKGIKFTIVITRCEKDVVI